MAYQALKKKMILSGGPGGSGSGYYFLKLTASYWVYSNLAKCISYKMMKVILNRAEGALKQTFSCMELMCRQDSPSQQVIGLWPRGYKCTCLILTF